VRGAARDDIAPLLAAHLAPVAAMLFLGQSGREILLLLAVDTALTICVLTWLVIEHITEADSKTAGLMRALTHGGAALVVGAFFSIVLVVPIAFVALGDGGHLDALLASQGFQAALAMQVVGSAWALVSMHRELVARDDDETYLSTRFKFVVARWVVVLGLAFSGLASLLGPALGAALLVLAYCGAGIWFGLDPARAHRLFHPDKDKGSAPGP
jgi:hypothetical protein